MLQLEIGAEREKENTLIAGQKKQNNELKDAKLLHRGERNCGFNWHLISTIKPYN